VTPGPGAYNVDMAPPWERRAPKYSLSTRSNMRSVDDVPSPNSYQLPPTIGARVPDRKSGMAVTLTGRSEKHGFAEDLAKTPGPAQYGINIVHRGPEYSLLGRNFLPAKKNTNPGPGTYEPQNVNSHLESSPRFRIGVRHSEFVMPTITPADCD